MVRIYEVSATSIEDVERLLIKIKSVLDPTLELNFNNMIVKGVRKRKFVRKPYSSRPQLFKLRSLVTPDRVRVRWNEHGSQATIATNPTLTGSYRNALLYLRTAVYPGTLSETFIAKTTIDLSEPFYELEVEPYIPRVLPGESIGDPRVDLIEPSIVYHSRSYSYWEKQYTIPFKAYIDRFEGLKIVPILFSYRGEPKAYNDVKDVYPLNPRYMLFRPYIRKRKTSAVFIGFIEEDSIDLREINVIPELTPMEWEILTGFNFLVKMARGENMLFYYSEDPYGVRRVYVAILSDTGEFLGGTIDPVMTPSPLVYVGGRTSSIMPCGAIIEKNRILVSVGIGDNAFAIYEADLDRIMDRVMYRR